MDINLEKEICKELKKQVPTLQNEKDEFIVNYIGVYPIAFELCCNSGFSVSDAVSQSIKSFR